MCTDSESLQSLTWRKLCAIEFSLRSFAQVPKRSHVKWLTDSHAAARIVEVGSMKLDSHGTARTASTDKYIKYISDYSMHHWRPVLNAW